MHADTAAWYEAAVAKLLGMWQSGQPPRGMLGTECIAGSEHDQITPQGVMNPYWDIVRLLPAWPGVIPGDGPLCPDGMVIGPDGKPIDDLSRYTLTVRFAGAIPSPGDMAWLRRVLDGRGLVEVGAGAGYWAWQARQVGIDVVAYEPHPPGEGDNEFVVGDAAGGGTYTSVVRDDATAAKRHPDRALLLCWPSNRDPWAAHALSCYQGDLLIFVGEGPGGCTADDAFFELLEAEWEPVGASPHHVTFIGPHSRMVALRRLRPAAGHGDG